MRFLNRWLWWRIRQKKKAIKVEEKRLDAELGDESLQDSTPNYRDLGILEIELAELQQKRLVCRARALRIHVPRYPGESWLPTLKGRKLLTDGTVSALREQVFQRIVILLGFIFGFSSLVQTVYTVLGYYYPRR